MFFISNGSAFAPAEHNEGLPLLIVTSGGHTALDTHSTVSDPEHVLLQLFAAEEAAPAMASLIFAVLPAFGQAPGALPEMSPSRHFAVSLRAVLTTFAPAFPIALAHFASVFVVKAQPGAASSVKAATVTTAYATLNPLDLVIG
jgi:hypothetical protein